MWFKLFMALGEGGAVGKEVSAVAAVNLPRYHFISPATMLDGRHCSEWALNVDLAHCVRGTPWYTVSVGHTGRLCQGDTLGHFVRETHWH